MKKIKVVYLDNGSLIRFFRGGAVGGGTGSNYNLIDFLSRDKLFDVSVVTISHFKSRVNNLKIISLNKKVNSRGFLRKLLVKRIFKRELDAHLHNNETDIVITSTDLIYPGVRVAFNNDVKTCCLLRSYENIYNHREDKGLLGKLNRKIEKVLFFKQDIESLRASSLVVTNSEFLRSFFKKRFAIESTVVYPSLSGEFKKKDIKKIDVVGVVNPSAAKGFNTTLEIAKKMKDKKFFYYGKKPKNEHLFEGVNKNIFFKGWKESISNVYSEVDIIIVPSLWEEPFGKVSVEAISFGVLPIISKKGGLPETVDNDERLMIDDAGSVQKWIERIQYFEKNLSLVKEIVEEKQDYIKKFTISNQGNIFKNSIKKIISES